MTGSLVTLRTHDFGVADSEGEMLGVLRVKPTHLWWRGTGASKWRRIDFDKIVELVERDGEDVVMKQDQPSNGAAALGGVV